jgi:tetratricopeptide (TPR) repeat protein
MIPNGSIKDRDLTMKNTSSHAISNTGDKHQAAIDKLKAKLEKTQGLGRARILNELAGMVVDTDPTAACKYAQAALKIIGDTDHRKDSAIALLNIGIALFKSEKYDKGFNRLVKAVEIFENDDCFSQAARARFYMGEARYYGSRYFEAIEHYKKALEYFDNLSDLTMLAQTAYRLGTAYGKVNVFDQALPVFEIASETFVSLGNMAGVALVENCIGLVYHGIGNHKEALKYHLKALKISEELKDQIQIAKTYVNTGNDYQCLGKIYLALSYLNKALKLREKSGDIQGLISVHINMGTLYFGERKYEAGIVHSMKALELNKRKGSLEVESFVLNNIGIAYTKLKQFQKAARYLNKAYEIIRRTKFPINEELIIDSLAELAEAKGDYKTALKFHKRLKTLQVRTFNENLSRKVAELEARNEMKKREQEIAHLKEKLSLQNRKLALLIGHSAEKKQLVDYFQSEFARIKAGIGKDNDLALDKKSLQRMLDTQKDMIKFREAFDQVYPGFYDSLTKLSHRLTKQEKTICLLIKIGLQSPMISRVLFISLRTVENHRLRIRKKIKLNNNQSLKTFLESYSLI